jgi:pimeloyl-ACP methyl ester carboxylesterase
MNNKNLAHAVSADGTKIGYWTTGEGPPLVLVHGLLSDHTRWVALQSYLESHFTLHAMDRRGRGASGDGQEYAFERECEDAAAVIEAVSQASGDDVNVLGSSGGALYSIGAAVRTKKIRRLVLFEPPSAELVQLLPAGLLDELDALLEEGDREGVLVAAYRAVVGLSEGEINHLRSQPSWTNRIAAAHTVPRELRVPPTSRFLIEQARTITVPSLVLVGDKTPQPYKDSAEAVAAALPDAELAILDGQGHGAEMFAPEAVSARILAFLHNASLSER